MQRPERIYLQDIADSIEKIQSYVLGLSFEAFEVDSKTVDAVLRNFEIIGESANNLSSELQDSEMSIPWGAIISMRNALIHEYFGTDLVEVWKTIADDIPVLKQNIGRMLASIGER